MTILDACQDQELFARWFRDRATWQVWFVFLVALFGLPMTPEQAAVYQQCTGRSEPPTSPQTEGWLICGRRAGKSFVLALIAVFLACFRSYAEYLAPGERATVMVIATDRRQARVIYRFVRALIAHTPLLAAMIDRETADTLDLTNSVTIEVGTASYRSTRGYTLAAVLCDEIAFWPSDDSAEPDYAILDALRPGMSTIPGAMLLCASSPYARRGALWDAFRRYFGKDDTGLLVWKAATRTMNPTVPQAVIDRATERDAASAAAEYGAEFRIDVETFVSREAVEAVTSPGVYERPPVPGVRYVGFVDPSGGSSDSMTLAIAHKEGAVDVLDAVRERRAPFSPQEVVAEFAETLKRYHVSRVTGDRYGGEWPPEAFRKVGIRYDPSPLTKSEIYRALLPKLNSGEVDLLDVPRIGAQLVSLERRTSRGGRDTIDHPPQGHDDLANAVAGSLVQDPVIPAQAVFGTYGSTPGSGTYYCR
jgi:hypothetical protein